MYIHSIKHIIDVCLSFKQPMNPFWYGDIVQHDMLISFWIMYVRISVQDLDLSFAG